MNTECSFTNKTFGNALLILWSFVRACEIALEASQHIYIDSWVSQYAFMKHLIFTRLCFYAYGCSEYYDESGNIMKNSDDHQKILMIVRKF